MKNAEVVPSLCLPSAVSVSKPSLHTHIYIYIPMKYNTPPCFPGIPVIAAAVSLVVSIQQKMIFVFKVSGVVRGRKGNCNSNSYAGKSILAHVNVFQV